MEQDVKGQASVTDAREGHAEKKREQPDSRGRDRKKKKTLIVVLVILAVIAVLSALALTLDPEALVKKWFADPEEGERPSEIRFYPVDVKENIFTNPEYAELDRRLHYTDTLSGTTVSVEEEELSSYDAAVVFFYYYFDSIIRGDVRGFLTYYASDYAEAENLPTDFTMQMLYQISVTPLITEKGDQLTFLVDYRIHRNNGTFRSDIGSDAGRQMVYTLCEEGESLKIRKVIPYTQVKKG